VSLFIRALNFGFLKPLRRATQFLCFGRARIIHDTNDLCRFYGFSKEKEVWQADDIVYISFIRNSSVLITLNWFSLTSHTIQLRLCDYSLPARRLPKEFLAHALGASPFRRVGAITLRDLISFAERPVGKSRRIRAAPRREEGKL